MFDFEEQKTRSALLLEQAAYAFLEIKKSPTQAKVMVRKYALHLLLCAHLYKQADQVNKYYTVMLFDVILKHWPCDFMFFF